MKKLKTTSSLLLVGLPYDILHYKVLIHYEFPYDPKDVNKGIQQIVFTKGEGLREVTIKKKKVMARRKWHEPYMVYPTVVVEMSRGIGSFISGEYITSDIFNDFHLKTIIIRFSQCRFKRFNSIYLRKMYNLYSLTFEMCLFVGEKSTFKFSFPKNLEVFILKESSFSFDGNIIIQLSSENTTLTTLRIVGGDIDYVTGVDRNRSLRVLEINTHSQSFDFLNQLTCLEYLTIHLMNIFRLNDLTSMKDVNYPDLKEINIVGEPPVTITNFGIIPKVKTLNFYALIPQDKDLSILNGFTKLEELDIKIVVRLITTQKDGWPQYYSFSLKKLKRLELLIIKQYGVIGRLHNYIGEIVDVEFEDITFLSECYNIEYLKFTGKLKSLNGLDKLNRITEVDVSSIIFNTTMPIISKNLEILRIDARYKYWDSFKVFIKCKNLEKLWLYGNMHSFDDIDKLKKLKTLSLINHLIRDSDVRETYNIQSQSLKKIVLNGFKITNLYFLKDTNITTLMFGKKNKISSIDGIQNMVTLKELHISSNSFIQPDIYSTITETIPIAILILKNLKIYVEGVLKPINPMEFYYKYNSKKKERFW